MNRIIFFYYDIVIGRAGLHRIIICCGVNRRALRL